MLHEARARDVAELAQKDVDLDEEEEPEEEEEPQAQTHDGQVLGLAKLEKQGVHWTPSRRGHTGSW